MGSFLSSLVTPPPLDDGGDSAVVAVHSKAAWDQQFEAHRNAAKLMVIDFSASWCGPCRFIEPAFKEMASRFTDAVFVKIDVDELGEVAKTFRVEAMPTFVLVKGGQEVSRVVGAKKDELDRKIKTFIASC
ncbi:thioredoxin H2-2-like [Lolium rigidum]|uniref:thioredoxin H2-2-like n=1 Tax=Lolium rigidum TaxID=89674 RepID=UPI001F5DC8AF|nr:thioredoxin H2-2-like [Lolium rigidum]